MAVQPIDIHIHPFTEETCMGHGPSFTEAHYDFFGRSPEAPHHGKKFITIDETYQHYDRVINDTVHGNAYILSNGLNHLKIIPTAGTP